MTIRERAFDRGTRLGREALARIGRELREARRDRGLSLAVVAAAVGISAAEVSRIERGLAPMVPALTLARCLSVVGLDLSLRAYPGGEPIRDQAQVDLLADFRALLHRSIRWATEVPMPIHGDQRAWDATVGGAGRDQAGVVRPWSYGVDAETLPRDAQALHRRLQLKQRDSGVTGVLLVLRDTRAVRTFLAAARPGLADAYPIPSYRALELLGAGVDPGGSAIVIVPRRR